nr:2-oxo acid dehydrogenase subunit E2 [Breznakibacter sp.]
MIVEIKVPTPGESINEVEIVAWSIKDGDIVQKNQELAEIESDKASLAIVATEAGKINILIPAGSGVKVNSVACTIDTSFAAASKPEAKVPPTVVEDKKVVVAEPKVETKVTSKEFENVKISPVAKAVMDEQKLSVEDVINGLKRLSKEDVEAVIASKSAVTKPVVEPRSEARQKMSQLRKKLASRLVAVKNETAMLTTFNEVDVTKIKEIRTRYGAEFEKKYGTKLGFMSFFI